jgi:hypothetical protein
MRRALGLFILAELLTCVASDAYGQSFLTGNSTATADLNGPLSFDGTLSGPPGGAVNRPPPIDTWPVETPQLARNDRLGTVVQPYGGVGRQRAGRPRANAFADCDDDPHYGVVGLLSYDSFRGVSDESWQNNGVVAGINYGTRLGDFSELTGIGFQAGATVGVYDFSGTDYRLTDNNTAQTQGFFTYGFFRKPTENLPISAAIVQDWMFNDNFGVYAQNPTLSQLRWQAGYAINAKNEIGLWGAERVMGDTRFVAGTGATSWRPVNQLNPYWHYKWTPGGADTTIWIGVPDRHRYAGNGSLGDYIAGATATVPFNEKVSLYTLITYMHPSSRAGFVGSTEDNWNFTIGVQFYPGRNARSSTVAGRCWLPQMQVANNGLFMVDTNRP